MQDRDFKGVWIPKDLWLDKTLNPMQKSFLLEINRLDNSRGCYASNAHFSELFGLTKRRCGQIIRELEEMGLVTVSKGHGGAFEFILKKKLEKK